MMHTLEITLKCGKVMTIEDQDTVGIYNMIEEAMQEGSKLLSVRGAMFKDLNIYTLNVSEIAFIHLKIDDYNRESGYVEHNSNFRWEIEEDGVLTESNEKYTLV